MAISVTVSDKAAMLLIAMAAEDGEQSLDGFLEKLLAQEDQQRHIEQVPHQGEHRKKCFREHCKESEPSWRQMPTEELGN